MSETKREAFVELYSTSHHVVGYLDMNVPGVCVDLMKLLGAIEKDAHKKHFAILVVDYGHSYSITSKEIHNSTTRTDSPFDKYVAGTACTRRGILVEKSGMNFKVLQLYPVELAQTAGSIESSTGKKCFYDGMPAKVRNAMGRELRNWKEDTPVQDELQLDDNSLAVNLVNGAIPYVEVGYRRQGTYRIGTFSNTPMSDEYLANQSVKVLTSRSTRDNEDVILEVPSLGKFVHLVITPYGIRVLKGVYNIEGMCKDSHELARLRKKIIKLNNELIAQVDSGELADDWQDKHATLDELRERFVEHFVALVDTGNDS